MTRRGLRAGARPLGALVAALGAGLAGCSDEASELRIEGLEAGDAAWVLFVADGRRAAARMDATDPGRLSVPRDDGTAAFVFRLTPEDVRALDGSPAEDLYRSLEACLDGDAGCARCTVPSPKRPLLLAPGDACRPSALTGARIGPDGGCQGDSEGTLCAPGLDGVQAEIASARTQLRLRVPGAPPVEPDRGPVWANTRLGPAPSPAEPDAPMHAYALADNRFAALGDDTAVLVDLGSGELRVTPVEDLGARPEALAPWQDGFIAASRLPRPRRAEQDAFHYFEELDGVLLDPVRVPFDPDTLTHGLRAIEDRLWIYGDRRSLLVTNASLSACEADGECTTVPFDGCPANIRTTQVRDLLLTPEGQGLAVGAQAVFAGNFDDPSRSWSCHPTPVALTDDEREVVLESLYSAKVAEDGIYACAQLAVGECDSKQPVVLTSTSFGPPRWRIAWTGPRGFDCRPLLPPSVPGPGVRAVLGGGGPEDLVFDVVFDGAPPGPGRPVSTAFGSAPGAREVLEAVGGQAVLAGPGQRIHVTTPNGPRLLLGRAELDVPDWVAVAPRRPGPGFWVLAKDRLLGADVNGRLTDGPRLPGLTPPYAALAVDPRGAVLTVDRVGHYSLVAPTGAETYRGTLPESMGTPVSAAPLLDDWFVVLDDRTQAALLTPTEARVLPLVLDDPGTPEPEGRPQVADCDSRTNLWLAGSGRGNGVVWAAGKGGLLVRFTALGGLRKVLPTSANLRSVRFDGPDRILVGGLGTVPGAGASGGPIRLQIWGLDLSDGWSEPPFERHQTVIETSGVASLLFQNAVLLLPDEPGSAAPTPVLLEDGYLPRLGADDRFIYRRAPLRPHAAAFDGSSTLLLLGGGGTLAVGRP